MGKVTIFSKEKKSLSTKLPDLKPGIVSHEEISENRSAKPKFITNNNTEYSIEDNYRSSCQIIFLL